MEIIDEIVEAYKARRGNVPMNPLPGTWKRRYSYRRKRRLSEEVPGRFLEAADRSSCIRRYQGYCRRGRLLQPDRRRTRRALCRAYQRADREGYSGSDCRLFFRRNRELRPDGAQSRPSLPGPKLRAVCEKLGNPACAEFWPLSCHRTSGDRGYGTGERGWRGSSAASSGSLRCAVA